MSVMLPRKKQIAIALETVEGTEETIEAKHGGLLVFDPKYEPDLKLFDRPVITETFSKFRQLPGQRMGKISFRSEFKGSGVRGVPPRMGVFLRAAGWTETITETTGSIDLIADDDVAHELREGASTKVRLAQQFTSGTSEVVTAAYLRLQRNGTLPAGAKVWVQIETDSAGAPSGTAVTGYVSNQVEAAHIGSSAYETVTFGFAGNPSALTDATVFHLVLYGDYTESATNNIQWSADSIGSGGFKETWDGTTWTDDATENMNCKIVAGTSVAYTPNTGNTTAVPSATVAAFMGDNAASGLKKPIAGARSSFKMSANIGEPLIGEFEFMGLYVAPTDTAPLTGVIIDNDMEPPVLIGAAFTIASFAALFTALSMDMGATVTMRDDPSAASGYRSSLVTDRRAVGSFDPEEDLVANHDFHGLMIAGTEGALAFTLGSAWGNTIAFSAPKAQYTKLSEAERNAIGTLGADLAFNRTSGDDEMTITFT
jgi:hypothetical protein